MKDAARSPHRNPLIAVAGVSALALLTAYVAIMVSQESAVSEALPWALLMALGAGAIVVAGRLREPQNARIVLIGATILFSLLGLLSILSIGIGFIVVAILSGVAAARMI